jgi:hypothetical protein
MCGREGTAPDVRGAKSACVNVGNYRTTVDVDVALCERCAGKAIGRAMDELILALMVEGYAR